MDTVTLVENSRENVDEGVNLKKSAEKNDLTGTLAEVLNKKSGVASLSNRREYEKRLLTFQASTYYAKPPCLSPLFCARFGWQNADKDMLVCTSCSSALAITLNSKLSANTFDKICQAYRNKIVSCHATSCPFRLPSIKQLESLEPSEKESNNVETDAEEALLNVPVYMSQVLPEESVRLMEHPKPSVILRKNAKKLSDAVRSISCVANKNTTEAPSSSSWSFPRLQIPSKIRQLNSSMELTKHLDCDDESILALSLLGWGPIPNICLDNAAPVVSLGCPCCFSILDLRLEHKIGDDSGTLEVDDENETDRFTKRQRISSRHLNPLEAHRHYCPYKVGFPEKAGHSNPLWKTILKRLGEECRHGEIEESTSIEEISAGVDVSILDESVGNVRRMLRAGIATKNVDLVV